MPLFEIDPDIRKAHTLPSEFYLDERFFELARTRIFERAWHFVATASEVDNLMPVTLLNGFLNEPLLLVNDGTKIDAMSNVCTHRGKILVEQRTKGNLIRCDYHGRRFSLDGRFLSMPEFEELENFPCSDDDLSRVELRNTADFLFVSLDPAITFNSLIDGFGDQFKSIDPASPELVSVRDYEVNAHWALYCENYLEGFHIPYVHRSLNEIVDFGNYRTDTFRYSSVQTAYDNAGKLAARYLFLFPNMMFNFYPWGVSVNVVIPVAPKASVVRFMSYVADESLRNRGAGADLDTVELEDEAVVESVQKGIRSRYYDRGRYSPTREQGTHHFHRLLAEFMG